MNDMNTIRKVLDFMQHQDKNGDYMSYFEDLKAGEMSKSEVILSLLPILRRWYNDMDSPKATKARQILHFEYELTRLL